MQYMYNDTIFSVYLSVWFVWLIVYLTEEKGWERVAAAQKEADLMAVELADTIYFSQPNKPATP